MIEDIKNKSQQQPDFGWVKQRRAGNIRIVWYIVAFCFAVMAFSGWSFIRFMEQRTGYDRDQTTQQGEES